MPGPEHLLNKGCVTTKKPCFPSLPLLCSLILLISLALQGPPSALGTQLYPSPLDCGRRYVQVECAKTPSAFFS